jgi:hypothetical protein
MSSQVRPIVGGRVMRKFGLPGGTVLEVGESGVLITDDGSGRPFQVRGPRGDTCWFNEDELVAVPRPVVGGLVRRIPGLPGGTVLGDDEAGILITDDGSARPFQVRGPRGDTCWFNEDELVAVISHVATEHKPGDTPKTGKPHPHHASGRSGDDQSTEAVYARLHKLFQKEEKADDEPRSMFATRGPSGLTLEEEMGLAAMSNF